MMFRIALLSIILALLFIGIGFTPVMANDEPDSVTLSNIYLYQGLITDNDTLAVVPYGIPFTVTPDEPIDDTFLFSMLDTDNSTVLAQNLPYPYYDLGYGSGIVSFYLTDGVTWNEPYTFRVQENPTYYETPQKWDFVIGATNYTDNTSDQSSALRTHIIGIATNLTPEYEVDLLTSNEGVITLSTYGEQYFLNAIPGLEAMCPELFSTQLRDPDYTKRSWDYTIAEYLTTRYSDTFIGDFMTGFAGLFSMDTAPAMNFLSVILFAILMFVSVKFFRANTYSALMDGYAFLILLMLDGFFSMILTGFIAFLLVVIGGAILLLNRD